VGVGGQRRVKPPADAAHVQDEPRADDARPGTLREVLGSGALLQLPGRLLELFVRHLELRPAVVPREPQTIAIARPIVVRGADAAERSVVGEVVGDRRIEIAAGARGRPAHGNRALHPAVGRARGAAAGGETAGSHVGAAMPAAVDVLRGRHFDHAAKLAAVLGREISQEHVHRLEIALLDLRREGRRAVLVHRDAVEYEERLVLGAARMQHAVGFHQPAGLGVDETEQTPARDGR
jgi:hypothetical protein